MSIVISGCLYCKHLWPRQSRFCAAFPDGEGIPRVILHDEFGFNHRLPFPGDNGIQFDYQDDLSDGERTRVDRVWPRPE
jgi:hypothetical protein